MARVLVVDDEAGVRLVIGDRLRGLGHSAAEAGSAEEALRLAEAEAFDLILLDVSLPGMTGLEALPALSRLSRAVVVLTGHHDSEVRADALLLGAAAVVPKPLEFEALAPYLGDAPEAP